MILPIFPRIPQHLAFRCVAWGLQFLKKQGGNIQCLIVIGRLALRCDSGQARIPMRGPRQMCGACASSPDREYRQGRRPSCCAVPNRPFATRPASTASPFSGRCTFAALLDSDPKVCFRSKAEAPVPIAESCDSRIALFHELSRLSGDNLPRPSARIGLCRAAKERWKHSGSASSPCPAPLSCRVCARAAGSACEVGSQRPG